MRADADLMVYVAARWPSLVRDAVLLGARPDDAGEVATDALTRCRSAWGRVSREANVDALVREELARAASRRARTPEAGREDAARQLPVLAPPTLDDLSRRSRELRRATLRRAALVAVPLLLVGAGAGAYVATTGGDDKPAPKPGPTPVPIPETIENAAVSRQENPAAGVIWYADGGLHLDHVVLAVQGLRDMTRLGDAVVYGDDEGRVVFADDDGSRRVLGHTDPDVPVAATDETGWAAWVDPEAQRLVVEEAQSGIEVGTTEVDPGSRVLAVDGHDVYYQDGAGAHAFTPGVTPAPVRPISPARLLDVRSRIQVFQFDDTSLLIIQPYFSTIYRVRGQGAELSPDGNLVATTLPDGEVALYNTASGLRVVSGLRDGDDVLALSPRQDFTVAYVVTPESPAPGHELELRTCRVLVTLCSTEAHIGDSSGTPVLAR